ncbi:MAG: hypothetical protein OEY67_09620 [Gammaproteobacteria bacterium]|nr:hypothetical protein [Gammaproteobacteria bacterium]
MASNYNIPILPQYVPASPKYNLPSVKERNPSIQIIAPYSCSPVGIDNPSNLADTIFKAPLPDEPDLSDFISGKVDIEKSQLQILLEQIEARHKISNKIRYDLQRKELEISSDLLATNSSYPMQDQEKAKAGLQKRMDVLEKERNMEYVALWRDTQKVLLEIMKRWSTLSNLERRSGVINGDL